MFIEIITKKNDKIFINVNSISYVTPRNSGVTLILNDGDFWDLNESYESITSRINVLLNINK